jgi:uncharacterized protein (DUF362 family)
MLPGHDKIENSIKGKAMSRKSFPSINRRDFIKTSIAGLAAVPALRFSGLVAETAEKKTKVAVIRTQDRQKAVKEVFELLEPSLLKGKKVFLKPNFNSADPFPASTHNDTLSALIQEIKRRGAKGITVGERSGPPLTQKVLEDKGIQTLAKELGFDVLNFEELPEADWVHFDPPGSHWSKGFYIPRPAVEAEYLVSTCCLKTHQYGGIFTMSLKLSVGLTPKRLMRELHSSPDQRKMIAEINTGYSPRLIVMDGLDAFVDGGPSTGKKAQADVFIGGTDRIAVDAVGVAVLKELGSNDAIMTTKIFEQEQIKRAVELGLGISGPQEIDMVTPDERGRLYADKLKAILALG